MNNTLTQEKQPDFVLIGFPYDIGAHRSNITPGHKFAPDSIRKFLPLILTHPQSQTAMTSIISDYGNIQLDHENPSLEELITKLRQEVNQIKNKNQVPIVIGGTKDCSIGCFDNVDQIISFINIPDVSIPYDNNKVSMNSGNRVSQKNNCVFMGFNEIFLQENEREYIKNYKKYSLKNIQGVKFEKSQNQKFPKTKAGYFFKDYLEKDPESTIHLSFSMEVVDSAFCPGVSRQNVRGLTSEEAIEIFQQAGLDKRIQSIDISDYNPIKEEYRSGVLMGSLIYNFLASRI